jgi:tRNA A37 threonylcarbamoyladenosine dehydratase
LLRSESHILPRKNGKYGVDCLYVDEHTRKGEACVTSDLSCSGYGSVVTVTASMGFAAAALCVNRIVAQSADEE